MDGWQNAYNTLHGGEVAAAAQEVAMACVKTVAGDTEFFLGESAMSYLSAATLNVRKLFPDPYYASLSLFPHFSITVEFSFVGNIMHM